MQPRIIGSLPDGSPDGQPSPGAAAPAPVPVPVPVDTLTPVPVPGPLSMPAWDGHAVVPAHFGIALPPDLLHQVEAQAQNLGLHALSLTQIAGLGADTEVSLHQSLGAFLDRIDRADTPQIFQLVTELNQAVQAENLGDLADRILDGKPGFLDSMLGRLSPKRLAAARDALFEQLRDTVSGKTRKLTGVLDGMERRIETEKAKAIEEAETLERLKDNYRARFVDFAQTSVLLATVVAKARAEFAALQAAEAAGRNDSGLSVPEAQDKLQALESRALALEGVFTKLPAEQLVIRQVQTAALQTVQEVTTTTAARFASIKMTLLTLHGAMGVQNLQRVAQQGADLDQNLAAVRNRLVGKVVESAANAPGDNRLAQARQLRDVVQNTEQLQAIVEKARTDNAAKFEEARGLLQQARTDLAALGAVIRPDKPLAR